MSGFFVVLGFASGLVAVSFEIEGHWRLSAALWAASSGCMALAWFGAAR